MKAQGSLYGMKIHDVVKVESVLRLQGLVQRVPGGWIYHTFHHEADTMTSVFVPFSNEFQGKENG